MKRPIEKRTASLALAALIAASYVILALISESMGLFRYAVQLRLPEALSSLVVLTPAAVPGLTLGCFIANLMLGSAPLDIAFGPIATFIGASLGRLLAKKLGRTRLSILLMTLPTVFANTLIMPPVISASYGIMHSFPLTVLFVFLGEFISASVIGSALGHAILRIGAPKI